MRITLLFVYFLIPLSLFAQDTKKDTTTLQEVVILASRFPEKKEDVAQQIQLLKKERIQQLNAANPADLLQQMPGVLVQKSQLGGGSPIVRGFEANKVLLVVDGVRMNNAIYRGGHLQNVITLDNEALDRLEVGFGPSSVAYGSDALGGVIHAHTKNPELNQISYGAFSRYSSAANAFTAGITANYGANNWASLTQLSFADFNDLRQGDRAYKNEAWKTRFIVKRQGNQDVITANPDVDIQRSSGYRQYDVLQKISYRSSHRVSHLLNLQYSTSSDVPRYDRLSQVQNNQPRFSEWYYGPQDRLLAAYQLKLEGFKSWFDRSNITLSFQDIKESRHDRRLNTISLNQRFEQVQVYALNADFSKHWKEQELSYGFEFSHNDVNSVANQLNINTGVKSALDTRYPDGGSSVGSAAAFLAHRWELKPQWLLNSGFRLNWVALHAVFNDKTFFAFPFNTVEQKHLAWSGNLGLIFQPNDGWRFSILGSTGFRAPNVDDLAKVFESVAGNVIVPNPDLKPEYTYNLEFSLEKNFANKTRVQLNTYYTWYRDAITTQASTYNGQTEIMYNGQMSMVSANMNVSKAFVYGVSAGLDIPITKDIWFKNDATYTFARITSLAPNIPLDHIPPFFGFSRISYEQKKFQAEFFLQFNGTKRLKDYHPFGEDNLAQATPEGMPAWQTLNFRSGYQWTQNFKVQLALENILDQNYRVFASGISAPGRNFIISLRGNF
ncbi:MAG: hypothetical protein RI924_120 [Bacteroidota bacterium]|jgi:hemoglobin/transferrin/lactoferrin receptor protein